MSPIQSSLAKQTSHGWHRGASQTALIEKAAYDEWRSRRSTFQARVAAGEPDAVRAGWQRDYIAGRDQAGGDGPRFHRTKRILPKPVR
ncbi:MULTISPECIES: DUF6065 family protein [Methylorubrum]|uniref:DUF6065 family protein n=1 Tax=Methylorubrum TaxID=2282523 RepID=UPI0020A1FB10|nr:MULTISPECIES: DUF6065 family protein [Methylorubrum]MCP1550324.1 hypothetical protein [Methylorubrum zatmanii]MCP1553063.1 hypothetical protein [Methylorubrum extorquens]MCP1580627.1 hypothetical protein [Methylorubrum extorquens]